MRNFLFLLLVFISSQALSQVTLGPSKRTVYDLDSWDSLIAVVADNGLEIWDISQRRILDSAAYDGTSQFSSVCFGRDYRELVTGRRSGEVCIWNLTTGEKRKLKGNQSAVTSIDASLDLVAVGSASGVVTVYDLEKGDIVLVDSLFKSDVSAIHFSLDGTRLYAGSGDGIVRGYFGPRLAESRTWKLKGWIGALSTSSNPGEVTVGADNRLTVIQISSGKRTELDGFSTPITAIDIDYNNAVAVSTMNGVISVRTKFAAYKFTTGDLVTRVRYAYGHAKFFNVVAATMGKGLILVEARAMKVK